MAVPTQSAAQIQAALNAAGLSPAQQAGVRAGTGYTPGDPSSSSYVAPSGGGGSSTPVTPNPSTTASTQTYLPSASQTTTAAPAAATGGPPGTVIGGYNASGQPIYVSPASAPAASNGQPAGTPVDPTMPSISSVESATQELQNDSNPQNLESGSLAYQDEAVANSQSIIDQIESSFNDAISTAGGNAAAASAASGFAGSPEAGAMTQSAEEPDIEARSNAVAQAALAIQSQAASDYNTFIENADTNSQNVISAWQKSQANLVTSATAIWASGQSPTALQQSNPEEYNYLLQYAYNGDPNAMNAAYIAAGRQNLLNSGQPVYSAGGNMVFAQYDGVNADGTPNIQFVNVNDAAIPPGYKPSTFNQSTQGQTWITYNQVDSNGNVINPQNAITTLNGVQVAGPGTTNPNMANVNPQLTGMTIGNISLGIVPTGVSQSNALAAQAIIQGQAPPPTSTSGTVGNSANLQQMKAYMAANGYDLTTASEDYAAVQKWTTTQNSTTVLRAVTAATSAQTYITGGTGPDGTQYTGLQQLAAQWDQQDPLTPLNAATLQTALSGAMGQQAQNTAIQFNTQLNDLQQDMSTVFTYGLASTDSRLSSAQATLSSNWDESALDSSLQIISQNLAVRINSLRSPQNALSASGDNSGDNPYIDNGSGASDSDSSGATNDTTTQPAGTIVTYNGQQYTVGADGNTLTPVSQ